jgi:hypothetical protein
MSPATRIEMRPTPELLDAVWRYPLFEALYGRRSRRFGLGFEMPEGPFRYRSAHAPVPLSELEEALLVGAGAGFSGFAFWDLPTPPASARRNGRTFPTTRSGGCTALFLTNDEGSTFSMLTSRRASFARSRRRTSAVSFLKHTARSAGSCAVADSTSRAAYRR